MRYPKLILSVFLSFLFSAGIAQTTPAINIDTVVLKLTITSTDNVRLQTEVMVEDLGTHKIIKVKTNKTGNASVTLLNDGSYRIRIRDSDDSYDYSIPDISISPIEMTLKFNEKQKTDQP